MSKRGKLLGGFVAAAWCSSAAQADWQVATSKHFVVYANDKAENVRAFTAKLERFDKAIKVMRNVPEDNRGPSARVTVFQVDNVEAIQKLYGGGNVAGFYRAGAEGPIAFVPRRSGGSGAPWELSAERVLLHEYSHHFMYADWPTAVFPRWYSEGFAEYHSTAIFNSDGSITFGAPPTDRAWGVADINGMPLARMLKPDPGKLDGPQEYALYSRGWALTHYLTQTPERRKMLADYIIAINAGASADEAAKVFGSISALDFKLVSYVQSPRFQSQVVPANRLQIGDVTVRPLTPAQAAMMPALIRSKNGVNSRAAGEVAAMARQAAAPYPADPTAQNELAEAEYDAKNFAAAQAAADRALAADPTSVHAMLYRGMAMQAVAEAAKSKDPAQWRAIRQQYLAANRVATEDPMPLILYYRSFAASDTAPTPNAAKGMIYAAALAPFDLSLRVDAARIYLQQGKAADARSALELVAFSPHGGDSATKMRDVLATLDHDGAAPALTKLDAVLAEAKANAAKNSKS